MSTGTDLLDVEALFSRARDETGLDDFGDDTLPDRVVTVVAAVRDSGLGADGDLAAARTVHGLLTSRLGFFDDRKRFPIASERIVRPLFATGEHAPARRCCMRSCRSTPARGRCASGR